MPLGVEGKEELPMIALIGAPSGADVSNQMSDARKDA
jgi:hypothetical protein